MPSAEPDRSEILVLEAIVHQSGVAGLRAIPSFDDEVFSGDWKGYRSSRLTLPYRVVYRVEAETVTVYVMRVTAHDYREVTAMAAAKKEEVFVLLPRAFA